MKVRVRKLGKLIVLAVILSDTATFRLGAQAVPQPAAPGNSAAFDPTQPEKQPRLDVDRDPVPSPDPEASTAPPPKESAAAASQPNGAQKPHDGYVFRTDVDEVLLSCTVLDEKGRMVTDLGKSDFHVWEDGKPQTIISVSRQDAPVSLGILVDNSGSMRDKRSAVNVAALDLLRASNPQDMAFIVNFSDRAYLDQGFTSDLVALKRGLTRFDSHGTTALYDAVAASADEMAKHAKERKQVLLIITDGSDNASRLTLAEAIRRVQGLGGPVVYAVGLLFNQSQRESAQVRNDLVALAEETGGIAYFPHSLSDLNSIADQVAGDIRNQYTIDYRTSKATSLGGYRSVRVEATAPGRGRLSVRTKRGYYARPTDPSDASQISKQD